MELNEFARQLNDEVRDRIESGTHISPFSESAFTSIVLEYLSEIGMVDSPQLCHHEGKHRNARVKISGYAFSDEGDRLDLFVSVFRDLPAPEAIAKEDLLDAAQQAARFYKAVANAGYANQLDPSTEAFQLARGVYERRGNLKGVRVFVLTDGLIREKQFRSSTDGEVSLSLEVMDVERLFRGMQAGLPRDEVLVDFEKLAGQALPCVFVPGTEHYTTCLTVIPGNVLHAVYEQFGARLLESNVRSFLSVTGKVNKGIRETLRVNPKMFLAYNNGIVVTADEVALTKLADGSPAIHFLRGMQVVNGGQTTASIHRAKKVDKADLSKVFVPAKIITLADKDHISEMVGNISRCANSQNTIQPADFSANEPFHIQVEKLANTTWCPDQRGRWFYERARGSYQVAMFREGDTPARLKRLKEIIPPQRRFSKPELAKYMNAWDQKPHLVSLGSQKNFDSFMQGLRKNRESDWLPDETWFRDFIAKAILFREAQRLVRSKSFPAHQANICTYLVSYLSVRAVWGFDFARVWKQQDISAELRALLLQWAPGIDGALRTSAAGRMVTEWAKKEACWYAIRRLELGEPAENVPELGSSGMPTSTNA